MTGLQLGDTVFGRNEELSSLKECYRRSVSGKTEFAFISGHAGIGKSFLAYEFGKHVIMSGGVFLAGKFDQLQQGKPFSALAAAFNGHCGMLMRNSELREVVASKLRSSLGREVYYLTKIIPTLNDILGSEQSDETFYDDGCVDAQRRLQYLLCQFVEVLSSSSTAPLTLFLDDLQWADSASIAAVTQLLCSTGSSTKQKQFFFVGCHREGIIDSAHPVWELVCNAELLGVPFTSLNLDSMAEDTLNAMVSETLCVLPRLTRTLSNIIYRKTKGNPLFVSQLMLSLNKKNLLFPSLNRRRWEWDNEKIMSQKLPDDVAVFFTQSIADLPSNVRISLFRISCFGASVEIAFVKTFEIALEMRGLCDNLDIAVDEETITLLTSRTDEEILNTRPMTDTTMIIAMKFLAKLEFGMNQTKPRSVPFVTQKIIELSLAKGMSPMSPIGFVYLGGFMSKLGDFTSGYRYVKLALSLLDKVGRECAGEVICIATQVKIFVEPIQSALEHHNDGYAASMVTGDIFNALLNTILKNSCVHVAGVKLQTMREEYKKSEMLAKENNHSIFLVQIKQVQRDVLRLIGSDEEVTIPVEEKLIASNNSVLKTFCFRKAYISFMFRSYDDAKEYVSKFFDCHENAWASLMVTHIYNALYTGLISFWVARKSRARDAQYQYWIARGNESKLTLKRWVQSSPWTFENKWYLLEAEESFSQSDYVAAKLLYKQAISSAKLHKFVHEEALAYELAAYFHLELGEMEQSMEYFLAAHGRYNEWGAFGKCNSLFEFVKSSFSPASIESDVAP
ncbi:putative AAA ATPase [Skeletonema marinoi]|uniref:AAA ATPase n=1 Tax=Skeletonema marinoi TaxID=267567 RepID=A0AAD8XVJ0_9STRA|nr:putative AAA ATPase [Skeletonema marinoi]